MLHTLVRVTVHCDTTGCPSRAERVLANGEPRALLAAVRRSLRRRDGWTLASRLPLIGPHRDLCPTCQENPAPTAPGSSPETSLAKLEELFAHAAARGDRAPERTPAKTTPGRTPAKSAAAKTPQKTPEKEPEKTPAAKVANDDQTVVLPVQPTSCAPTRAATPAAAPATTPATAPATAPATVLPPNVTITALDSPTVPPSCATDLRAIVFPGNMAIVVPDTVPDDFLR